MPHKDLLTIYEVLMQPFMFIFILMIAGLGWAVAYQLFKENIKLKLKVRKFYGETITEQPVNEKLKVCGNWWKKLANNFYQMLF